jgi:uncharacterized protein YjbI with pentapeptide repeats
MGWQIPARVPLWKKAYTIQHDMVQPAGPVAQARTGGLTMNGIDSMANGGRFAAIACFAVLTALPVAASANCSDSAGPNVNWSDCRKRNLMLDGNDLSGAVMSGADLTSTDLRKSKLEGANLEKAVLGRAMLDGSSAKGANFEKAQGIRSSFVGTDLSGANFTKSEMQRADFTDANLAGAHFEKSELARAVFAGADLNGAVFSFANLARADLRGAKFQSPIDFTFSYMYRTRIDGVDLSSATGLAQWQVDLACGDQQTKLPAGLNPGPEWPCADE